MVLGVHVGAGDLEEPIWRPHITAVENVLASWRKPLSFRGRALVIGSLALSRIWYVASLVHMPKWAHAELAKVISLFFWRDKRDLVARVVVTQPSFVGGFSVVGIIVSFVLLCCLLSVFKACVVLFTMLLF